MSTADTTPARILPDSFFYSEFRNLTDSPQYLWWAGGNGKTIAPGARFRVLGDPRAPDSLPRAYSRASCLEKLVQDGILEFCSSPSVIFDNLVPDGKSAILQSGPDGTPTITEVPYTAEETAGRVLPVYNASPATGNAEGLIFDIYAIENPDEAPSLVFDWSWSTGLMPDDRFSLAITLPTGKVQTVKMGRDRIYTLPNAAIGDYLAKLTLRALNKDPEVYEKAASYSATGSLPKPTRPIPPVTGS
jgi:hypothetical protein